MRDSLTPPRVAGTPDPNANPETDPELAAILDFQPVPRQVVRPDGWSPERQRQFILLIAQTGSAQQAAVAMGKKLSGIESLYREEGAESFRRAWDAMCERVRKREEERFKAAAPQRTYEPPHRRNRSAFGGTGARFGGGGDEAEQVSESDFDEARNSISSKLLRARRLYLQEISHCPGKRAAFEILTEYEVDWDKAAALEPQPDEPWRRTNQRQADMVLMADSGWSFGDFGYGPDKKAQLRRAIDEHRAEEGLPPIDWSESIESSQ